VAPAPSSTVIKLKRSTTASTVPTTANLEDGEIAVNVTDKKLYVRNGESIIEVANNTSGAGGGTDLTNVSSNILPDTDEVYNLGSLTSSFKDFFYAGDIKQQVDIFTNSAGLGSPVTQFAFRANTEKKIFINVFTSSGGLSTPALSNTTFNDNNPAYRF
jgi:hypothetical protein